ncbi:pre-60S factor rei1 [Ciborinia camelliae]|nr:pre-60S factor rei1 [Ciborinia camelliae]
MSSITASRSSASGPSGPADTNASHPYTCNTCQVAFRNSDLQRGHMRSDWHRYNLKRRVTSLPPISSEVFTEKVLQAQATSTAAASKAAYEKSCTICTKTYFSENAYQNHLTSQKHKAKVAMAGDGHMDDASSVMSSTFSLGEPMKTNGAADGDADAQVEEVSKGIKKTNLEDVEGSAATTAAEDDVMEDDGALVEASTSRCLFCNEDSVDTPANAAHMERIHGMYIPEKEYLVDLEGLIVFLHQKIYEDHECLGCGKLKQSIFGLQTHMRDKRHCRIRYATEDEQIEIGEYYDFRSTYSDEEDESDSDDALPGNQKSGGVKLGAKRPTTIDGEGDEEMENGDGWETDSSESSLDSADLTAVPLDQRTHQYEKLHQHPHHSHTDPRSHHNKDGWHSHAHKHNHAAFYSDYELHLPSGRTAGHRSLQKYYRQNLVNHPSPEERQRRAIEAAENSDSEVEEDERVVRRNERERGRALNTRANGGLGMAGVTAEKRKEVQAAEKRSRKVENFERRKFEWRNNKQNNSQKHFRDPLLQ